MPAVEVPPLRIGPIEPVAPVVLAPMAGVTNRAFRRLCREFGAGLYVSEINKDKSGELQRRFSEVKLVGSAVRLRGAEVIKRYVIYRLAQPVSLVLDAAGE